MKTQEHMNFTNPIKVQCFDKDGNLKWEENVHNGITDVGIEYLLEVAFRAVTAKISTWYIGLIDNSGFTALDPSDVMNSHTGWSEYINYSEVNRVTWAADAEASRAMTNSVTADFTISGAGGTVKGIFVTSDNTISGTTGTLWSTAAFSSNATVVASDELKITYTISG